MKLRSYEVFHNELLKIRKDLFLRAKCQIIVLELLFKTLQREFFTELLRERVRNYVALEVQSWKILDSNQFFNDDDDDDDNDTHKTWGK